MLFDFAVYAFRDIWPLATFTLTPEDGAAGWFTWSRVIISSFVAVWLPLITPRDYIPVDPNVCIPSLTLPLGMAVLNTYLRIRIRRRQFQSRQLLLSH